MRPARSTTTAVPCWMACANSVPRSKPCTRRYTALQACTSDDCAGRTAHPSMPRCRGPPLHAGERLTDIEAEAGIERERAVVKRGLYQADSGRTASVGAIHHGLHQLAADAAILDVGVDGDGTDTGNRGALIEAIAAHDAAFDFGDDAVETGSENIIEAAARRFRRGEIARKTVRTTDRQRTLRSRFFQRRARPRV